MKIHICSYLVLLHVIKTGTGHLIELCIKKLDKGLTFIDNDYKQINFDGLFGVILAEGKY